MVDRVTAPTSTDPRAGSDSALEVRLAALANALGRTLRDLRDRVESVESRMADRVAEVERRVAESAETIERRVADIPEITSQTTTDLRAVLRHLEALQQRVGAPQSDVTERVERIEQSLSAMPNEVAARVDKATEGMRKAFEALPAAFSQSFEPFRGLPKRIEEALDAVDEMRGRIGAVEGGITQTRDENEAAIGGLKESIGGMQESVGGVEEAVAGVKETMGERFEQLAKRLGESFAALRDAAKDDSATEEQLARIDERIANVDQQFAKVDEQLSVFTEQLSKMADQLVDPVELAQTTKEATEGALAQADLPAISRQATESALATFGEEQERRSAELEKALGRVDKLSDALASIEKRRGARELIEGEQRLLEQQEALVQTVTDTANQLGGRVLSIEGEISAILERVDEKRLSLEIAEQVKASVTQLQETIGHELGTRLSNAIAAISEAAADRVATDVGAKVENLREELAEEAIKAGTKVFMTAGSGLQEEIGAMRAKIDAWGRARTAPKVAEEIAAMNERVEAVARAVRGELVDSVFDRMQRVFDRRFEVLVQLVETRIRDALDKREEPPTSHRRRFLRREEE